MRFLGPAPKLAVGPNVPWAPLGPNGTWAQMGPGSEGARCQNGHETKWALGPNGLRAHLFARNI